MCIGRDHSGYGFRQCGTTLYCIVALQWRHNERVGVSNHRCLDYLLNRLFWCKSKKTSKLRVTGLCEGNSPANGEFPTQRASNAENVSIWWRHPMRRMIPAYGIYLRFEFIHYDFKMIARKLFFRAGIFTKFANGKGFLQVVWLDNDQR